MKLPGFFSGLGFALLASTLPACTCSPSEAPAPAETAAPTQAEATKAPEHDASGRRFKLQRVEKTKRPMVERVERLAPMISDAGAPKSDKAQGDAASVSTKATPSR